jgi:hypothetical protein
MLLNGKRRPVGTLANVGLARGDEDPHACLADILHRSTETPVSQLAGLLPCNCAAQRLAVAAQCAAALAGCVR